MVEKKDSKWIAKRKKTENQTKKQKKMEILETTLGVRGCVCKSRTVRLSRSWPGHIWNMWKLKKDEKQKLNERTKP